MSLDTPIPPSLAISLGQWSSAGRKRENQDFYGAIVPIGTELALKGITVAIADGVSSSTKGREAAEIAVKGLLTDYYSTSDAATVKTAASSVIASTNGWMHSKSRAAHVEDIDHPPLELRYKSDGTLWMSAGPGRCQRGDALAVLMSDYQS